MQDNKKIYILGISIIAVIVVYVIVKNGYFSKENNTPYIEKEKYQEISAVLNQTSLPDTEKNLFESFKKYSTALEKKQFDKVANFMTPDIINYLKGRENAISTLIKYLSNHKNFKILMSKYKVIKEPNSTKILASIDIQTFYELDQTFLYFFKDHVNVMVISDMIALSFDNGSKWYFIQPSDKAKEYLNKQVPSALKNISMNFGKVHVKNDKGQWIRKNN